jgi:hypothetical protein
VTHGHITYTSPPHNLPSALTQGHVTLGWLIFYKTNNTFTTQ